MKETEGGAKGTEGGAKGTDGGVKGTEGEAACTDLLESCYLLLVSMNGRSEFPVHLLHLSAGPLVGVPLNFEGSFQLPLVPLQAQHLGTVDPVEKHRGWENSLFTTVYCITFFVILTYLPRSWACGLEIL